MIRRFPRFYVGLVIASVLFGASVFSSAAGAKQPECQVVNLPPKTTLYNSNTYTDPLGTAIAEAEAGDTLQVIGTCRGNFEITKDLTLTGRPSDQHTDTIEGDPSGGVLSVPPTVSGVHLTVSDLTITGGTNGITSYDGVLAVTDTHVTGNAGTGIANWRSATVSIDNSVVNDNHGAYGAGVYNSLGAMTISNSTLTGNTATGNGGGMFNRGTLTLNSSTVGDNSAFQGGGIYSMGTVVLTDSTVRGNTGSGVYNDRGTVQLTDSVIEENTAGSGGGIFNGGGSVTVTSSVVSENTSSYSSGGIENNNYNERLGTLVLTDSTVSNNHSDLKWGGLGNFGNASLMNTTVSGNTADRVGGISNSGTLALIYSTVSNNVATSDSAGGLLNVGALTLTDSLVTGNTTAAAGGGIYNVGGLVLTDSSVTDNTAATVGGGIYNESPGTVALYGTSSVCGNTPDDWPGCST